MTTRDMTTDEIIEAFVRGEIHWVCKTCDSKIADDYISGGYPICARCLWKKKDHCRRLERRNSELFPLSQLIKENLQ